MRNDSQQPTSAELVAWGTALGASFGSGLGVAFGATYASAFGIVPRGMIIGAAFGPAVGVALGVLLLWLCRSRLLVSDCCTR